MTSALLVFSLLVSIFPTSAGAASKDFVKGFSIEEANGRKVTTIELENNAPENLIVKITEEENKTVVESYLDGEFVDRTITYPDSDKMIYEDFQGKSKELRVSDYITTSEVNENVRGKPGSIGPNYFPPPEYTLQKMHYSDTWEVYGFLYRKATISKGPTHAIVFGAGTAVSTIIGLIGSIFSGGITSILWVLGATIVGTAIDTAINGEVYARTTIHEYEVTSQRQLGLRTYKEWVDAKVVNTKTAANEWVPLRESGDARSPLQMVIDGIFEVILQS